MTLIKGTGAGRVRWLAVFVVLFCASCAAPVLAESPKMGVGSARVAEAPARTAEAPTSSEEASPPAGMPQPDEEAIAEEAKAAEDKEIAREKWLESPEAIRQREESRGAFDDLAAADAEGVLGSVFEEVLKQLDGDPARALSDMQIEEVVSENGALVADGEDGMELVESPIPIRSNVPGEEGKAVELDLKESEGGFESKSPATDIRLPASLGGQVEVGEELAFATLPGNGEVGATRFGDKDLFYPNTDTDTDTFIAPLTRSVEVFQQLRSPKSPEQFRYGLTLPKDSTLRADGEGGAEAVNPKGERVASVPTPFATDAQGTKVPVSMAIEGDSVVVEIAHRSMDVAYPLLLDPELVNEEWYWNGGNTFGLGYWGWEETADYDALNSGGCIPGASCWGAGLYLRSKGNSHWYGPNTWGRWVYSAPNSTAYISAATFWTLHGSVSNCQTQEPHGWVGIWGSGGYVGLGIYRPLSFYQSSHETGWVGNSSTRWIHIGIGTGSGASQLACGHDFYVGGVMINQDDPENPGVSASGMPGGWISDATPAFTINSNGSDPGLGVRKTTFGRDGQPVIERPVGCYGTAASRCPVNRNEQFNVSALSFDEGKKNAYMTVEDVTGKKSTQTWQTYVDMTKPDVVLTGQLAVATQEDEGGEQGDKKVEELSLPVYNLNIKATDIGTEQNADHKKRSGVRKLEVKLDGDKKEAWEQPCSDSCSMEKTYSLKLNNLDADKHVLEVLATDGVGKVRERSIEFEYIPATGMKDEYVMQYFPLPDGSGNEAEEENPDRPELAVNVINGNLVYREKDVDVEGYGVNLEVERYYNSLLPEQENTEWGDGWTLAQTPDLQPEEGPGSPDEAMMVRSSGAVEGAIDLPAATNEEVFDPELQAVVTKEADGGYEVADASGETDIAIAFDENGTAEELRTEGAASVEYDYDAGDLAEIEVDDPASTDIDPGLAAELAELERAPRAFKYAFGLQGSADGQFKVATDVAIDPTDSTIWVTDDENNRIQHFTAEGTYIGKFTSCVDPGAVDVDLKGDIYVACSSIDKIQKYDDKGTALKTIAVSGSGNGQVRFPLDLALDPEGNLYVADTENARVQKFDAAGAFVKAMPVGGRPWGVDVAPDGRIWTAEAPERRVSIFDPQGNVVLRFGSQGTGHSQFERPVDVEVDDAGFAWVTDAVNNRIQVFDSEGGYVTQFGEKGTGNGQLNTDWWLRIAVGPGGDIWVTDQGNSRLHKWINPAYAAAFKYAFGLQGSADGQFKVATDVAIDPTDSTIWVTDDENNRIQHFTAEGTYIGKFTSCVDPGAVDVDLKGDIYVACSSIDKIQKYDDKGTALKTIAVSGSGNGQVRFPLDLALDPEGNLYVADTENARVQKFDAAGAFVKAMPVGGSGRPWGVDVAPDGNIWTAEPSQSRVSVFDPQGSLLFRFGSQGTGRSQFKWAADVEVDESGFAYVTDAVNNRVQVFDSKGAYVTQFGEKGTGSGQLNTDWWLRAAVGPGGDVWVTDQGNSRLHKWKAAGRLRPGYGSKIQDDPEVEVETPGGLVASVEGEEAGVHVYGHEGDLLTAHVDADGISEYQYDGAGRMTRVELPNGTWAKIEYGSTDGRVKKVTVDPAGSAPEKSTTFTYIDQPRSTKVILPDAPAITYDIGEDGSVFKWQNALKPPEFEVVSGTLYDVENKETATPIAVGDYNLVVKAYSEEGIGSIQVYANGNQLVSEKTCPQIDEEPKACKKLPDEWVTHTGNHAPGILNLEIVIEDGIEQVASKRFWVNVPYTPPPPPGQPVTPKFAEVLQFREEHGLDLDLDPVQDELEINDRVFDTINDWIQGGQVAVASMERWGVPLRTPEVAELEWRLQYWEQASQALPAWVGANAASTFAGHYLDERAGGKIVVGFTGAQAAATLAALEQNAGLIAGPDRIVAPSKAPQHTLAFLESLESQISAAAAGYPSGLVRRVRVDIPANAVRVGASNVSQAQSLLQASFGAQAPITVFFDPDGLDKKDARQRTTGVMRAGDEIWTEMHNRGGAYGECTASFGAFERGKKPSTGEPVLRMFVLAAGHCAELHSITQRRNGESGGSLYQDIGEVRRSGYETISDEAVDTDVAAIRLEYPEITPRKIFQQDGFPLVDVTSVWTPTPGTNLCFSGRTSKEKRCGPMIGSGITKADYTEEEKGLFGREGCFRQFIWGGDSGSPVWVEGTGVAVGVAVRGTNDPNDPEFRPELEYNIIERLIKENGQYTVQQLEEAMKIEEKRLIENRETCFVPLIPPPNTPGDGTVFGDPMLAPLHLVTRSNAK